MLLLMPAEVCIQGDFDALCPVLAFPWKHALQEDRELEHSRLPENL